MSLRPAVFLDRDGTLNVDTDYVHLAQDWRWIPGSAETVKAVNDAGFAAVVVTNQSGIARGLYKSGEVETLHAHVNRDLAKRGAKIDAFYFCPHAPEGSCDCRKPNPGMLLRAAKEHGLDLARSYMVGDKLLDVMAAEAAGVSPILVLTGHGALESPRVPAATPRAADLAAAWRWITGHPRS